jgi:hypothetical protein
MTGSALARHNRPTSASRQLREQKEPATDPAAGMSEVAQYLPPFDMLQTNRNDISNQIL